MTLLERLYPFPIDRALGRLRSRSGQGHWSMSWGFGHQRPGSLFGMSHLFYGVGLMLGGQLCRCAQRINWVLWYFAGGTSTLFIFVERARNEFWISTDPERTVDTPGVTALLRANSVQGKRFR